MEGWRNRSLDAGPYTYAWIDALTQKVREGGRILDVAVVDAVGVDGGITFCGAIEMGGYIDVGVDLIKGGMGEYGFTTDPTSSYLATSSPAPGSREPEGGARCSERFPVRGCRAVRERELVAWEAEHVDDRLSAILKG